MTGQQIRSAGGGGRNLYKVKNSKQSANSVNKDQAERARNEDARARLINRFKARLQATGQETHPA